MLAIHGTLETFMQETVRDGVRELGHYLTAQARRERIAATVLACQQNISPAEAIRRTDELIELLDADNSSLIPHPSSLPSSTTPAAGPSQGTPGGQALTNPPTGAPTCVDATPRAESAGVEPSPAPSVEAGACQHLNAAPAGAHSPTAGAATWEPTKEAVTRYVNACDKMDRDCVLEGFCSSPPDFAALELRAAYAVLAPMFEARIAGYTDSQLERAAEFHAAYDRMRDALRTAIPLLGASPSHVWDLCYSALANAAAVADNMAEARVAGDGRELILRELRALQHRLAPVTANADGGQ